MDGGRVYCFWRVFGNLFGNNGYACSVLSVPHKSQSQPQTVNSTNAKVRNANMNREVYQVATKTFQLNCRTVGYAYTDGECISCNLV